MWYCKFMFKYPNSIVCKSCTAFCMKRLNEHKEMFNFDFKKMNTNGTKGIPEYARSQSSAVNNIMKKTYKSVPFDIELAKKIQAGEIDGKIITKNKIPCRIVAYCNSGDIFIQRVTLESHYDWCYPYTREGCYIDGYLNGSTDYDLVLEVSNNKSQEPQFKPFDKVLVKRNGSKYGDTLGTWTPAIFQKYVTEYGTQMYYASGLYWHECILYEGNEHLVGTTDNPE